MKKALIIGGGTSGLAAGIRLQAAGYQVEILEKNQKSGGRMDQIEMDGYLFDVAPTILMMPEIYKDTFRASGVDPEDYLTMERLDPIYKVWFEDGTSHTASSELSNLTATLEGVSEKETSGYLRYLSDTYDRYLTAKNHFIMKAFRKPTDFYNPKTLYQALKLRTFDSAYSSVKKFIDDPKLRQILTFQTLYIGISPFNGPSIYTIIPMIELLYGVWFLKGGMYAYIQAMEKRFLEMGGTLIHDTPVQAINISDKKAIGATDENGQYHPADLVLNSTDYPYALEELLPSTYKDRKYSSKNTDNLEYSCSCYMMYLSLDSNDFPGLNVHNLYFSTDFEGNLKDIFAGNYPKDASLYVYAPSIQDPDLAPEGKLGLYVLIPVPNLQIGTIDWTDPSTLAAIRSDAYERIARITPLKDFSTHVINETILTPKDFESRYNLKFGATFGLKPTLNQSNYFRPQPKAKGIENLYFCGSSNHPGAGVPIVLTSAKLAVDEILKDDAKESNGNS